MMYIYLLFYIIYVSLKTKKSMHMLQQNFYNNSNRYLKWIRNNTNKTIVTFDLLFILVVDVCCYLGYMEVALGLFYFIMFLYYYKLTIKEQTKIPFKITARVKRMMVTLVIVYVLIFYGCTFLDFKFTAVILGCLVSFNSLLIYLINIINKPIEKLVYLYFFNKAKKKVKELPRLDVIGITGSYGKTSSKNILADILKVKYDTLPTPKNFNTPYGLMLTINNHLDKFTEYFIAEMGACEVGEIKELCDFVKPKYGILTRIGVAHLESFKTEENIQKTKFELIESLPSDGIGILNMDDEKQVSYKIKNDCKIKWIGIDNKDADLIATNIKGTYKGMTFDVVFKGSKKKYPMETRILGKANIYNILAAIMLASELGMSMEEITKGVSSVNPVEHRLEMKKMGNLNIIDDAYNSNPLGSKMAVETLDLMPGKKIIVTPGMIELKDKQYELNYEFGRQMSKVANIIILVGKNQTKPIYDALVKEKYDYKQLYVFDDVFEAFNLVRSISDSDTYILLENDLPDIFSE